eukprot:TRINITY_DN383_c0_g1_i14.p1 TRINITY_DN383_c0_g1~~TRINITY_DN383_c0_g1_i14.p1  ORF type:complete len:270 (-),score=29.20 TRINITY_DN383_c0_g1_i14:79-888(-)
MGDLRVDSKQLRALAFDADRRRVLLFDVGRERVLSADFDGTVVASTADGSFDVRTKVFVDRVSGTYTVVDRVKLYYCEVSVLDSELNVIEKFVFSLGIIGLALFALDSGGRVFALCSAKNMFRVSTLDFASGQVITVLEPTQLLQDDPPDGVISNLDYGFVIDSHDCFVMSYKSGRIATYAADGQLLSVFDFGGTRIDVRVSADGVYAIDTWSDDDRERTLRFVSSDGRVQLCTSLKKKNCFGLGFFGWTDHHLLVLNHVYPGPLHFLS